MKRFFLPLGLLAIALTGCEFETEPRSAPSFRSASSVVINEVFTLPPNDPNAHSWVELFNPTQDTVNLTGWSLTYKTVRQGATLLIYKDTVITQGGPRLIYVDTLFTDLVFADTGRFSVPFTNATGSRRLRSNEFLTIVSNMDKMEIFFELGPGSGPEPVSSPFIVETLKDVQIPLDSTFRTIFVPDTLSTLVYSFYIFPDDELVLRDGAGVVRDVVRFGSYVPPVPDPFPGNVSIGTIPRFESIARYAGGYATGSTANDFYFTRTPTLIPIPMYFSQRYKP